MPINSFENYPMSWKPSIDKLKSPLSIEELEQGLMILKRLLNNLA